MTATTTSTPLPTGTWSLDPTRSRVEFQAKHLGMAPARGTLGGLEGTLDVGGEPGATRAYGSVSAALLDTGNARRDVHLRSSAFLDAERHPTVTFASRRWRPLDGGRLEVTGDLTLHGVTRPVTLTAEPREAGHERLALEVTGRLDRRDFGMTSLPVLVSNTVELRLHLSAVKAG